MHRVIAFAKLLEIVLLENCFPNFLSGLEKLQILFIKEKTA